MLPVAVAVLPGALVGGEVGAAGTGGLGLGRVVGGSGGGEGGGLGGVGNALGAGLDPVRGREGGNVRGTGVDSGLLVGGAKDGGRFGGDRGGGRGGGGRGARRARTALATDRHHEILDGGLGNSSEVMLGKLLVGGGLGLGLGSTGGSLGGGGPGSCSRRGGAGSDNHRGSRPDGSSGRRRGDETTGRAHRLGGGGGRGGSGGSASLGSSRGGSLASRGQRVGHDLAIGSDDGTLGDGLRQLPGRGGAHWMNRRSLGGGGHELGLLDGSGRGSEGLGLLGRGVGGGPWGLGRCQGTGPLLGAGGPTDHALGGRRRKDAARLAKAGRGLDLLGTAPLGGGGAGGLVGGPGGGSRTAPLAALGAGGLGGLGLGLGRVVVAHDAPAGTRGGARGVITEEGAKVVERGRRSEGTKTVVEATVGHVAVGGRVRDFGRGQIADRLNVGIVPVGDRRRVVHVHQLVAEQVAAEEIGRGRDGGGIDGRPFVRGHDFDLI
mmetsp:Transcript_25278/g.73145  ORF Transcript_25278/g.73145 Transcript_25278/m.73145 type:complete len:491 (+) Transcript_25278:1445-2917(+)